MLTMVSVMAWKAYELYLELSPLLPVGWLTLAARQHWVGLLLGCSDEQMFYTAGDASRSTRCVITSLGDGCLGLCCRLLSGASLVCICKKNTLAPREPTTASYAKPRAYR